MGHPRSSASRSLSAPSRRIPQIPQFPGGSELAAYPWVPGSFLPGSAALGVSLAASHLPLLIAAAISFASGSQQDGSGPSAIFAQRSRSARTAFSIILSIQEFITGALVVGVVIFWSFAMLES